MSSETPQERLIRVIGRQLFSAPLIMRPREWAVGDVADAIWVSGRAIIFFYATNNWRAMPKHTQFQKAISHNLLQARKNISYWRDGNKIRASNSFFKNLEISHTNYDSIAIISVTDSHYAHAIYHHNEEMYNDYSLCVSIPGPMLAYSIERLHSPLDLIKVLVSLKAYDFGHDVRESLAYVDTYRREAIASVCLPQDFINRKNAYETNYQLLKSLAPQQTYSTKINSETGVPDMRGDPKSFSDCSIFMSDLDIKDVFAILKCMDKLGTALRDSGENALLSTLCNLEYYDVILQCTSNFFADSGTESEEDTIFSHLMKLRRYPDRRSLLIRYGMNLDNSNRPGAVSVLLNGDDATNLSTLLYRNRLAFKAYATWFSYL